MKKKIFKLSLLFTLLFIIFVIVFVVNNLSNGSEPEGVLTLKDLSVASLESDNAYYQILAFTYPEEIDITSKDMIDNIRNNITTGVLNLTNIEKKKKNTKQKILSGKLTIKGINADTKIIFDQNNYEDFERLVSKKKAINDLLKSNAILMKRFLQLLQKEKVEDFSLPSITYPESSMLTIMKMAKLYNANNIVTAIEGKWEASVIEILKQFNFFRKFFGNSRQLTNSILSQTIMRLSMRSLVFIMNQENCPNEVFKSVLDGLNALDKNEISVKNSLIFEFLFGEQIIDQALKSNEKLFAEAGVVASFFPSKTNFLNFLSNFKIFLNRNETIKLLLNKTKNDLELENTPPFQWEKKVSASNRTESTEKLFWWFSNPVGKALFNTINTNFDGYIYLKYETLAVFDLTKICAKFYQKYTPGKPLSEILKELNISKTIDPFSGKPYIYNEKKQIFYSIGINRIDDGGVGTKNRNSKSPDLVLVCKLKK